MKRKKKEDLKRNNKLSAESFYRFVIFLLSFLIILGILAYDHHNTEWKLDLAVGDPASKDIFSPFDFTFTDEEKTLKPKQHRSDRVFPIYKVDKEVTISILEGIDTFFKEIDKLRSSGVDAEISEQIKNVVSEISARKLITMEELDAFRRLIYSTVSSMLEKGMINFNEKVELLDKNKRVISLVQGEQETVSNVLELTSLSEARDSVYQVALDNYPKERKERNAFSEVVSQFLKANIIFDDATTHLRKERVYKETPNVEVYVKKNEIIVQRGRIISKEELLRMKEVEKQIKKKKVAEGTIGVGIIVLFFIVTLASYLHIFEKKIYFSLKDIVLINVAIVFNVLLNKGILTFFDYEFVRFLIPTSFASLLLAILISPRSVICVALGMSVLSGIMTNYDPLVIITGLFASIMGVYLMVDVRRRSRYFFVGALVGIINFLIIFAFLILKEMTLFEAFNKATIGFGNGAIITFLLFPGTFIFENLFDKTTSVSLLELSDLNHPLLKRLIIEAPGTYHHSLVVSNLAESASEAIGANSLLARVGSYFHDIGKIEKSAYFTENQTSQDKNFHDNLSPRMSYFIIVNHVKDGIELAKKYKLKKVIVDFIVQHHGTSVVYFFYKKALDVLSKDENINVSDFRYPGPKPQSKEVAIVLLADSVEAASRTLTEPTPSSLQGLVDKVVNDKFLDNQLDECELTVYDLHKIKESFVLNLMAIFHTRVEYPEMINESISGKKVNG